MGAGDVVRQRLQDQPTDWTSVARFALIGATLHGPFFLHGFRFVDRMGSVVHAGTFLKSRPVLLKTLVAQFTIFPTFICLFYAYTAWLEQSPLSSKQDAAIRTFATGTLFWIPANLLNFRYVPPYARAYYAAGAGVIWNAVVSYYNDHSKATLSRA